METRSHRRIREPRFLGIVLASFMLAGIAMNGMTPIGIAAETTPPALFPDVAADSPYHIPIQELQKKHIIKGYPDGTFKPDQPVNRAEFAVLLMRTTTDQTAETETATFPDVPADHWAAHAIATLTEQKVIAGYPDKTFKPEQTINRAEALKMLLGLEQKTHDLKLPDTIDAPFADVDPTAWYGPYFKVARDRNLFTFTTKELGHPDEIVTRALAADMFYRLIETRNPQHFFGRATFYSDFFEGRGTSSGDIFTQKKYTAANLHLPFGTYVRITNLINDKTVIVRINDRGPFTPSLDLDLTSTAFSEIAPISVGMTPVKYEIVEPPVESTTPSESATPTP